MQILFDGGNVDLAINANYIVSIYHENDAVYIDYVGGQRFDDFSDKYISPQYRVKIHFGSDERAHTFTVNYARFMARGEKIMVVSDFVSLFNDLSQELPF